MKKLLSVLGAAALLMTACQKEPSLENGSPGSGGSSGAKLVKVFARNGTDSITTNYSYTGNFISGIQQMGRFNGQSLEVQTSVKRNNANLITKTITTSSFFPLIGMDDSLVLNFTIDPVNSRYRYGISHYHLMGTPVSDSIVYSYDGAGRLISETTYQDDGTGYAVDAKSEYAYNGNNLASLKSYTTAGGALTLDETITYEYDTKINPLQFVSDAPVLGIQDFYPANNAIKETRVTASPAQTVISTVSFTYNSSNKPAQGVTTQGSSTSTSTYTYQ